MHPRERRTTRRHFLLASGGTIAALSGADALLQAAEALGGSLAGAPMGPGGIPLARRDHPVALPYYPDNHPIDAGRSPERGPLNVFNWADYINPKVVKGFEKQYGVTVNVTTFENEEEALAKLASGQGDFDVWFATVQYLSRAVAGKVIQPLNHHYLPNLHNVWPALQNPFYDQHSRYSVPYTIYTTGITWRKDKLSIEPTDFPNPYDIFWHAQTYKGKVSIIDDQREALALALLHRHHTAINTGQREAARAGAGRPLAADEARQRQDEPDRLRGTCRPGRPGSRRPGRATWPRPPYYMPKGVPVDVVRYWRPKKGAVVGSDMITILRNARNPVLAHHFLDYVLDNKHGLENFGWLGYIPPLKVVNPDKLVAQGYIPKNSRRRSSARSTSSTASRSCR